tara:strand:+ start:1095 stop:1574 length:480 start_codon:yes stop_codon:yes gene_type:complete
MPFDVSWLAYYMPVFGFLFVFTVIYAILAKTSILGESPFTNLLVSFLFGIVFITFAPGVDYVQTIIPWFVILIISLFFLMMVVGFSQKDMDKFMQPSLAWVFIGILVVMFLWSAIVVFNPFLQPYVDKFLYSERLYGAVLLALVAGAASWIITRKAKGD